MTSCTVETINAVWTACAYAVLSVICVRTIGAIKAHTEWDVGGRALMAMAIVVAGLLVSWRGTYFGQQALRYHAAGRHGHECVYDSGGSVHIKRGGAE